MSTIKTRSVVALAVASVVLVAGAASAATGPERSAGNVIDDALIVTRVKAALVADPVTKARDISVEVSKGRVQLNGSVDSPQERLQAVDLARHVSGVTTVQNNLQVSGEKRTPGEVLDDSAITVKVKAALAAEKRTEAHQINVETRHAIVSLGGFVDSAVARDAATDVAKAVTGVKSVENKISVK